MEKPICKLTNSDGNVFAIIGNVSRCLREAGMNDKSIEFQQQAFDSKSYDEVLRLCTKYVVVE